MAAAVGSKVGFQTGNCVKKREASNYQNCASNPTIQPHYENHFLSSDLSSKLRHYQTGSESESFSSLPDLLPVSDKVSQRTQSAKLSSKNHTTSISLAQSEVVSSSLENNKALSHENRTKNRSNSAQLRLNRSYKGKKTMGSGSSVVVSKEAAVTKKQSKRKQTNDSSIDDGGFECGTPKPALGVKEKLRYSLDKLSLKSPFRWSSSDKISHSAKGSKSKLKNNRRYSDSSSAFFPSEAAERKKNEQDHSKTKNVQGLSRMVRPYPSVRCESIDNEVVFEERGLDSNHDYVNLSDVTKPLKLQTSDVNQERRINSSRGRTQNDYYQQTRTFNQQQEMSTLPSLKAWKSNDTATRAKGTWKMLKTARSKQIPVKTSEPNLQPEYNEYSYPNQEYSDYSHPSQVVPAAEFTYSSEFGEISSMEPPKLAPVSGKLLLNKDAEKTILRPTAFRPTPVSNHNSPLAILVNNEGSWRNADNVEILQEKEAPLKRKESDCTSNASNRSDSGRHSATSIPVGVTNGGSFSCSGSEGYESARIPSSTNHSAVHDHECSVTDVLPVFSPRKLSDETLLSNLETKMRERQDQVDILRKDIEDNQKALRDMVLEEASTVDKAQSSNTLKPKEKTSSQIKLQRRASMHEHQMNEQHYRRLHQEQKQLHDANTELEERIKTMTEAVDAHNRQEDLLSEMRIHLEEAETELQQQRGEISLLKRQIKEKKGELSQCSNEILGLKTQNRDLASQLALRESENESLQIHVNTEKLKIIELEQHLATANMQAASSVGGASILTSSHSTKEFGAYRTSQSAYVTDFSTNPVLFADQNSHFEPKTTAVNLGSPFYLGEREELYRQLQAVEHRMALQEQAFEREQQQWAEDKRKVIKYQKLLQENYVQMYKRSHALEQEVKQLKTQLQITGVDASLEFQPDYHHSPVLDEHQSLSFPMEI